MRARASILASARIALIAVACAACAPETAPRAEACPAAAEAQVQEAFTAWTSAYAARDLTGVMAIFDPAIVFEFQGAPNSGYAELESAFRAEFAGPPQDAHWVAEPDTIMLSGEMANVISTWRLQATANGATETRQTNRAIDVLERGEDCAWRITRSLNYPLTPPA